MSTLPFLQGLLLGFSIAAPVGPIGLLCIRRTLTLGRLHGFLSGLGATTADALYGLIAGLGLSFITDFLLNQQSILQGVGGLFLCYLGFQTFRSVPAETAANAKGESLFKVYASTLFLTISNPTTILSFLGVFAGLGIASSTGTYATAFALVTGVFLGSAAWWMMLSLGVGALRNRLNLASLKWVNRISGLMILAFGLLSLWGLFR